MNERELEKKAIEDFTEYMENGYSGGNDGLRCDVCDKKYRGTAGMVQLCPICKAIRFVKSLTK